MNLLNPYKLLGVTTNSTSRELKKSYYMLSLLCHPDKGGDKNDMDIVHKAYLYVKKQLLNNEDPVTYDEAEEEFDRFCKEQEEQPPPFSKIYEEANDFIKDFNREFKKVHKATHNPFKDGYGHLMEPSDNEFVSNLECNYNGEKQLKEALETPLKHTFSKEVVIYKEPHYLPDTYGNYYNFDIKKIDDFSDKFKNNLEGTDYLKAFSPIEKVKCNRKSYNNVEEFLEERDSFVKNLRSNLC
jgi:curved DNA-binding protein CbpA